MKQSIITKTIKTRIKISQLNEKIEEYNIKDTTKEIERLMIDNFGLAHFTNKIAQKQFNKNLKTVRDKVYEIGINLLVLLNLISDIIGLVGEIERGVYEQNN